MSDSSQLDSEIARNNKFPCIPNLSVSTVDFRVPWEHEVVVSRAVRDKHSYVAWRMQPTTEHLHYCGFVGAAPYLRVSDSNIPRSVGALVADFDSPSSDLELVAGLGRAAAYHSPRFCHRTYSGGARLVWVLERPLLLPTLDVCQRFLKAAAKALRLRSLLPGFDVEAWGNPRIYFDVGSDWQECGGAVIPWAEACGWLISASDRAKWKGETVALDVVRAEMEERFPGRWQGEFELGARGVRFWDPAADNPTGAIVRETGMQCFTGLEPFASWATIFGSGFVERNVAQRIGSMIEDIWHDGDAYWYRSENGNWDPRKEREMSRYFKIVAGLSGERMDGQTHSEVEAALHVVDQTRRLDGAAPFVYKPAGMMEFMGKRVLNTARVAPMAPSDEVGLEWGESFPWVGEFLQAFFDPWEQLEFFLAWTRRFWQSARDGRLRQGQTIFIAGETGRGKTLLSNKILSRIMGGHADASKFLLGDTGFNRELFHVGLWAIDDATPGDSVAEHKKFSSLLKKMAANRSFEFHAKFRDPVMIEWAGRVVVTGNLDAESLRILPDLDTSILDKLMLFVCHGAKRRFPAEEEMDQIMERELPHFLAWLDAWEAPAHVLDEDPRYGVISYHHPLLRDAAGESTGAAMLSDILGSFLKARGSSFTGNATELMQELMLDDTLRPILGRHSPQWVGVQLGKLESKDGSGVSSKRSGGKKVWIVESGS